VRRFAAEVERLSVTKAVVKPRATREYGGNASPSRWSSGHPERLKAGRATTSAHIHPGQLPKQLQHAQLNDWSRL